MKELLIAPRFVYSFNHDTDNHGCGWNQGSEPACKIPNFLYDKLVALGIGKEYVVSDFSSPPATGEIRYKITRITEDGVFGRCTKNTVCILDMY